ncbi:PEP-CTERM sorting domain-containing protein [Roseibacillus ishigakijimensis]|nr:PEP-CTERM sorting domain-containing protein [Roseibacillus ishigakijimensis]
MTFQQFVLIGVSAGMTISAQGQGAIPGFFEPSGLRAQPSTAGLLTVNNVPDIVGGSSGFMGWSHSAGGAVGVNAGVNLGFPVGNVDVAHVGISTYAETTGSSLVFGRNQEISTLLSGSLVGTVLGFLGVGSVGEAVDGVVADLVASGTGLQVLSDWNSTATVAAPVTAGQEWEVSFMMTKGASLLDITSVLGSGPTLTISGSGGAYTSTIDLLGLLDINLLNNSPQEVSFTFEVDSDSPNLEMEFDMSSLANIALLNAGADGDTAVMSFSDITLTEVTPIPEPSTAILGLLGLGLVARRRRA